jgi:hypothetical protein
MREYIPIIEADGQWLSFLDKNFHAEIKLILFTFLKFV